jgi:dolichol-phosphate mannosyltransferase
MSARAATTVPAVSVVVPVHNEAENVAPLLAEIHAALEGVLDYEVVYVDDGSTDATPRILKECLTRYPRLRPLRHVRNSGQSAAMVTGVRASRASWIVTLDGDGQNDPADIPALLAKLSGAQAPEGPAMICGQRTKRRDTWLKRVSSKVANGVRGWVLRDHTPDIGCGLKVFKRDVFLRLPHFDHMHRFLPALFQRAGEQVVSVPVSHRSRAKGRSHYGMHDRLWVGIVDILGVLWLGRRMKLTDAIDLAGGNAQGSEGSGLRADAQAGKAGGTGSA